METSRFKGWSSIIGAALLVGVSVGVSSGCQTARAASEGIALVYKGQGVCSENCPQLSAKIATRAGLKVKFFTHQEISPELFKDAVVVIMPGGNAFEYAGVITHEQKAAIREFIHRGGGYFGICAGAFFVDDFVDDHNQVEGLGFWRGDSNNYLETKTGGNMLPLRWRGENRYVYFEDGGRFQWAGKVPDSQVDVVATFSDGSAATIFLKVGQGRVAVTMVHPEAPATWKTYYRLKDPDGSDLDLADAMMRFLLVGTDEAPHGRRR